MDSKMDCIDRNIVYKISCKECSVTVSDTNIPAPTDGCNTVPNMPAVTVNNPAPTDDCDMPAAVTVSDTNMPAPTDGCNMMPVNTVDTHTSTNDTNMPAATAAVHNMPNIPAVTLGDSNIPAPTDGCNKRTTCYIGQSGRSLHSRIQNHTDGLKRGDPKCPLFKHALASHDGVKDPNLFVAKKISSSRTNLHRLITESEEIQNNFSQGLMNSKSEYRGTKIIRMQAQRTIV